MNETTIDQTLVLCDLDSLLLDAAGNLPQLQRDVLQLFASRGGRLTVFSQRSPRAVRSLLGGVRLSAPALVCGGTLAYNFSEGSGTALCSFEGMEAECHALIEHEPQLHHMGDQRHCAHRLQSADSPELDSLIEADQRRNAQQIEDHKCHKKTPNSGMLPPVF